MSNENELPPHIKARYGVSNNRKSGKLIALIATILLLAPIGLYILRQTNATVSFKLISFSVISDNQVNVTWSVNDSRSSKVFCVIRAQDINRQDVGYVTIPIEKSQAPEVSYTLTTSDRAVLAEILGCGKSTDLRVPPANFPPGVKIPAQSPPGLAPTS